MSDMNMSEESPLYVAGHCRFPVHEPPPRFRPGGVLLGLCGPAGAGKTTMAQALDDMGYIRESFAAPLRAVLEKLFPEWAERARDVWSHPGRNEEDARYGISPRQALRVLGQELRHIDPEIWVVALSRRIRARMVSGYTCFVVDDVRFPAEAQLIRDLGGRVVHLCREGLSWARDHESEQGPAPLPRDDVLYNHLGKSKWVEAAWQYGSRALLDAHEGVVRAEGQEWALARNDRGQWRLRPAAGTSGS